MVSTRRSAAVADPAPSPAKKKAAIPKKRAATPKEKPVVKEEVEEEVEKSPVRSKTKKQQPPPLSPEMERKQEEGQMSAVAIAPPTPVSCKDNGIKFEYEFGGPLGALCVITSLPAVIYALFFLCNKDYCLRMDQLFEFDEEVWRASLPGMEALLNDRASWAVIGWMAFHVTLERLLPGEVAHGAQLSTGNKLAYTLSGHLQFWVTLMVLLFGAVSLTYKSESATFEVSSVSSLPLSFIYDEYLPLITASTLFSLLLSLFVYAQSFLPDALLAEGGVSGNIIYDFFIGRELNPRLGSFDIKEFCELRPGLIGWMVINLGMAAKQREQAGAVSLSMVLINVFQGFYVWDALHAEKSILTTMDITTDGFGFMLAFGDLAWVPFIYSLQARYLVDYDPQLDVFTIAGILALQCFGYYVFRAANSEKDAFRRNPDDPRVRDLTFLETKRGTRLITSGWWGMARKINYTGDWIMTFSWCLLCGWQSPIPYFQAVYFLVLLVHRALRDDKLCHEKYGDDWLEYKRRVPYVFIPYVI